MSVHCSRCIIADACECDVLLQMVDYQMLKEDNSVLRRELDSMKT